MAKKYLDDNGVLYLWQKITNLFVKKEAGKGLSTNDLTDDILSKINSTSDKVTNMEASDYQTAEDVQSMINNALSEDFQTAEDVQSMINESLANLNKKEVVTSLDEMTDPNTIYLIQNGTNPNAYDEYIVVNGEPEKIGSTNVDLTGYLKETDFIPVTNSEIDIIAAN
jgi:hypothetical protein